MKKTQYVTIFIAFVILCLLWAFGKTVPGKKTNPNDGLEHKEAQAGESILTSSLSIDSVISVAKAALPAHQSQRLGMLEKLTTTTANKEQNIHAFHQLSLFWRDTARAFLPYAWYTAEAARLENSEKNLNFAGHLLLNNVQDIADEQMKRWMALQAKDLFERSLIINPNNDSAKVGLGATYLFGGISNAPMQGITKIREVVNKDSTNVYAQMTLAMGSLMSGQTEKALERLETVNRLEPQNLQAILLLADIFEKQGNKTRSIEWYSKTLPLLKEHPEMKTEVEKRISSLKKQD